MMNDFNWTCPHCDRAVTISENRITIDYHTLRIKNIEGGQYLLTKFIVCPNPKCQKFSLFVSLHKLDEDQLGNPKAGAKLQEWDLIPPSKGKIFPSYIPKSILDDYGEACLIKNLSPKASATLSRRCLQGILRDFWGVRPGRLVDEIKEIQSKLDPVTWDAIEAVRTLGNIGAHMEKDIDTIIDVDPGEAELLIGLIETLLREWYIAREEKNVRMKALIDAASAKKP